MGNFGFWEVLLIVVLIFLLFGANKFPTTMKNLAEGIKVFKKELKTTKSEDKKATVKKTAKPTSKKK